MPTIITISPEKVEEPATDAGSVAAALDREISDLPDLAERIALIAKSAGGRVAFSTSLGLEDQAILHAISESKVLIDVFTLDTGRVFPETLEALDASIRRYGIAIRILAPDGSAVEELLGRDGVLGFRRSVEARKACCDVRKVQPLRKGLKGATAWITGLRREQSEGRAEIPFAAWDRDHALVKVNPMADWSLQQLEAYVADHRIPVNRLHYQGFPSIGCQPCTRAVRPGEDIRAGRWWWERSDHKECGLHLPGTRAA